MGNFTKCLWLETKLVFGASLFYIVIYILTCSMDYFLLGVPLFSWLSFFVALGFIFFTEDFTLEGATYGQTKWYQLLGDLIINFGAISITLIIMLIFFATEASTNPTSNKLDDQLLEKLGYTLIALIIPICVTIVSHIYLVKHVVQFIFAYIQDY